MTGIGTSSAVKSAAVAVLLAVLPGAVAQAGGPRRYFGAGRAMVERGETTHGLRAVAAAIALDPTEASARTYLLVTLDGACCNQDITLHEAVLVVLPLDRALLDRVAGLYESRALYADAAALRMRGVPLTREDPEFHARLFLYFELVGDEALALRSLERYRALGGSREEILSRAPRPPAPAPGTDPGADRGPRVVPGNPPHRVGAKKHRVSSVRWGAPDSARVRPASAGMPRGCGGELDVFRAVRCGWRS